MLRPLLILVLCLFATEAALAEKRVALVIGNAAYKHAPALLNPKNDAEAIGSALKQLGFDVILGVDLDESAMRRQLQAFANRLEKAEVALVYYAGHGLQVQGRNYLVPVDAQLEKETDLVFQTIELDRIQRLLEQGQRTNILILDSCRDNPLARNLARAMGTRTTAIGRGLAASQTGVGTLIVYATQPDNVALDGEKRRHSPFAEALLAHIATPGLEARQMLTRVRASVIKATNGKQVPWVSESMTGDFYFVAAPAAGPDKSPTVVPDGEVVFWQTIKDSKNPADFRDYLKHWPKGLFADLARRRIAELEAAAAKEPGKDAGKPKTDEPKAEADKRKSDEAKLRAPRPPKQDQAVTSWYAPERRRGHIGFAHKQAVLDATAVAALERLAASVQREKEYRISLVASADRSEGAGAESEALSRARVAAVQQWLVSRGIPAAALRIGILHARGEGPEHRFASIVVEVPATDAPRARAPAPPRPGEPADGADVSSRLIGSQWSGTLSGDDLYASYRSWYYATIVRFKPGGVVEVLTTALGGISLGPGDVTADDSGTWSATGDRVCVVFGRIRAGQQTCYSALANADGSVTLSGSGLLNGRRFSK